MIDKELKQDIATQLIKYLYEQYNSFSEVILRGQIVEQAYKKYLADFSENLTLSSIVIEKDFPINPIFPFVVESLGQSFFENTAHLLCGGEKKEFTTGKRNNLQIEQTQKDAIAKIITDLSNGNQSPSLQNENATIFQQPTASNLVEGTDFTADVFFENDIDVVCIEIKTVKPNKGVFKVEKQKILEAKAALKLRYPQKQIKYFLAFPFDPLSSTPCGYDKKRFLEYSVGFTKYFDEAEILLGAEFWDTLSGVPQTMEEILVIINTVATPDFMNELAFLSEPQNAIMHKQDYLNLLQKWSLYQEYELVNQSAQIKAKLTSKKLENIYNQSCFKDGEYKWQRAKMLCELL